MKNLMDGILEEILRVTEVKKQYEEIGPAGLLALNITINPALERAKKAHSEGDTIAMVRSFKELKEIE